MRCPRSAPSAAITHITHHTQYIQSRSRACAAPLIRRGARRAAPLNPCLPFKGAAAALPPSPALYVGARNAHNPPCAQRRPPARLAALLLLPAAAVRLVCGCGWLAPSKAGWGTSLGHNLDNEASSYRSSCRGLQPLFKNPLLPSLSCARVVHFVFVVVAAPSTSSNLRPLVSHLTTMTNVHLNARPTVLWAACNKTLLGLTCGGAKTIC